MNCEITLLRHGACQGKAYFRGAFDPEMTPEGMASVQAQFSRLYPEGLPAQVFSSPLKRCRMAADLLAADTSYQIETAWRERSFGVWEGLTLQQIEADWSDTLANYFKDPFRTEIPQAEAYADFQDRIHQAWLNLLDLIRQNGWQKVCILTHGGPMRLLLQLVLNLSDEALFQIELDYAVAIQLKVIQTEQMTQPFILLHALLPAEKTDAK